jgi:hypothetical protein
MNVYWTEVAIFPSAVVEEQPVDPTIMKNFCKESLEEEVQ